MRFARLQRLGLIVFRYYTFLPSVPLLYDQPRTFVVLPRKDARAAGTFVRAHNSVAPDELQAHTGMFSAKTNDGYYELGLETAKLIREALMFGRGVFEDPNVVQNELEQEMDEQSPSPQPSQDNI